MKALKDSILEKLKIDDIILDEEKFPIDGTLDDMIKFLEDGGFIRIKEHTYYPSKVFNSEKDKCLYISDEQSIFFADTSKEKVSEKNPIFYIEYPSLYNVYYVGSFGDTTDIVRSNKKKFLKELNKRFGWE